jgi:hypothetical protein
MHHGLCASVGVFEPVQSKYQWTRSWEPNRESITSRVDRLTLKHPTDFGSHQRSCDFLGYELSVTASMPRCLCAILAVSAVGIGLLHTTFWGKTLFRHISPTYLACQRALPHFGLAIRKGCLGCLLAPGTSGVPSKHELVTRFGIQP